MTRARNLAVARVRGAGQAIESTLRGYVKGFPSLDRLPAFYRELVDVLLDLGRLKKHLAALDWAADKVRDITRHYRGRIGRAAGNSISELRREAYGRLSSVVNQISPDLDALVAARVALRRIPEVDPTIPTIVVAGYPNVGKSSFVRAATKSDLGNPSSDELRVSALTGSGVREVLDLLLEQVTSRGLATAPRPAAP